MMAGDPVWLVLMVTQRYTLIELHIIIPMQYDLRAPPL